MGGQLLLEKRDQAKVLGGVLSALDTNVALIEHRLWQGEKASYADLQSFRGKAAVSLKLRAFATKPRAAALFLLPTAHWNAALLLKCVRWERRLLRVAVRFRRRPEQGRLEFKQTTSRKMEVWMTNLGYTPMHQIIVEGVHAHASKQKDKQKLASQVRTERTARMWQAVAGTTAETTSMWRLCTQQARATAQLRYCL